MLTDNLWGGVLVNLELDVANQLATLTIETTTEQITERHELRLRNVSELRLFNRIDGPWTYVEVTEVHLEMDISTEMWEFEIIFWSEDAGLSGRCSEVSLDNVLLSEVSGE